MPPPGRCHDFLDIAVAGFPMELLLDFFRRGDQFRRIPGPPGLFLYGKVPAGDLLHRLDDFPDGEAVFRNWETQVLGALGQQSGLIIATGGGCVTQKRNYPLLHQNGCIFWLQRDIQALPTEGRPLSQTNRLTDLFVARRPLYEAFSDCSVDNNGSPEETVQAILQSLEGNG